MLVLGLVDVPIWMLLIVGIITLALWYNSVKHSHFKRLGIPGPRPWPFVGNLFDFFLKDLWTIDIDYKRKYGNVVGIYMGFKPTFLVFDQEMISQVMVKQFDHFTNRPTSMDSGDPLLSDNLLTGLVDDHWKHVRSNLSPTFTTGKLRQMAGEIDRCAKQLAENVTSSPGPFEAREACGNYTMDVIASTGFGLRVDSQSSKDNPFVVNAKKILNVSVRNPLPFILLLIPKLGKFFRKLGYAPLDQAGSKFFADVIKQTLDSRKQGDKSRSDFIQLMSNAKQGVQTHDKTDEDEVEKLNENTTRTGVTEKEIISNAFIFFLAGFDTTMNGLAFMMYNLARNPECQQKLIEEIDSIIGDKEDISYDDVMKMQYLEKCMQESLRMYFPLPRLDRECKKDIDINGIHFKKGNVVSIPVVAVHYDPDVWPDPHQFDPERFSPEEKGKRSPIMWLPFGYGPRNCIGMRLATYELKVAIVHVLRKHKLATCEKTEHPIVWESMKWLRPKNGIWVVTEKRE